MTDKFIKLSTQVGSVRYINVSQIISVNVESDGRLYISLSNGRGFHAQESEHYFLSMLPEGAVL